jgi:hypothetical protein
MNPQSLIQSQKPLKFLPVNFFTGKNKLTLLAKRIPYKALCQHQTPLEATYILFGIKRWVFLLRVLFFQTGELAPTLALSSISPRSLRGHTKPKKCKL